MDELATFFTERKTVSLTDKQWDEVKRALSFTADTAFGPCQADAPLCRQIAHEISQQLDPN